MVCCFVASIRGVAQVAIDLPKFENLNNMLDVLGLVKKIRQGLPVNPFNSIFERLCPLSMFVGHTGMFGQPVHGQLQFDRSI